ncbi:MAG: single-stranded-DNA-specific exonuclease RecJ [Lentisphaerae bacterium]|nr:single-stranded-DNA-specific exonuclease RecJ [Lentisphaerota bacterium]
MKAVDPLNPLSLPCKRWVDVEVDADVAATIADALNIALPLARILVGRGFCDPVAADAFLHPLLSQVGDPFELPDMDLAVARLIAALREKQRIVVFGDYDADGVTSTALLSTVLTRMGGNIACFLPSRFEDGYGLTSGALERCMAEHAPAVIVTVDCGTNSADSVAVATAAGVDVIVTDHHEPAEVCAKPLALINPMFSELESIRVLAGVGVAFKLCHALIKQAREDLPEAAEGIDLREWLDFVALGTVADVALLRGENRILVRHGLKRMGAGARPGLQALKDVAKVKGEVSGYHVGFVLGPRINAAGRLASGHTALDLLVATEPDTCRALAQELDDANQERRTIEDAIRVEAEAQIDATFDESEQFGLVAAGADWHVGTIGIVASRLVGRYQRPSIVIGLDGKGGGRGSGRSVDGVDLVALLDACEDLLETHGGHAMAAGLNIREENLAAFRERFNALCSSQLKGRDLRAVQRVDAWVSLGEVDRELYDQSLQLSPCGMGNPKPVWGARHVQIAGEPRRVGKDGAHLKLLLAAGRTQLDAIGFGLGPYVLPDGPIDILFEIAEDTYRGHGALQLILKDLAPSG